MFGQWLFRRHIDEDERLVRIVHKHWVLGVRGLVLPVLSLSGGLFVLYVAPFTVMLYLTFLWSVASFVWLLRNFFDYYLDAWIITDHGIIDVEWHGWFHRQSTRVLYSDLQGVSYEIQGVLGTLLRYGTISIEKISTGSVMSLSHVKNPRAVESRILRKMEDYLHTKNLSDAKHVQEILSAIVAREAHLENFASAEEVGA